jgi:hypothetical protein
MEAQVQQEKSRQNTAEAVFIEGVVSDHPVISSFGGKSDHYATFSIRPMTAVGKDINAQNAVWPVIIHRLPAVELMRSTMPGDIVQLRGAIQGAHFVVPRTTGRVDVILFD